MDPGFFGGFYDPQAPIHHGFHQGQQEEQVIDPVEGRFQGIGLSEVEDGRIDALFGEAPGLG